MNELKLNNVCIAADGKQIVNGIDLSVKKGEVHILMGPNGSGKSSLVFAIMGHPGYKVTDGSIEVDSKNITALPANERSKLGIFMAFQHPVSVPGINTMTFLRKLYNQKHKDAPVSEFKKEVDKFVGESLIKKELLQRSINDDFSGGEKKRAEVLQFAIMKPEIAIFDEIDSGLDVDAVRSIAKIIQENAKNSAILLITHHESLIKYVKPDKVHVMVDGRIVKSGGSELVKQIEEHGYGVFA